MAAGEKDEVEFGQGEGRRGPGVRFGDAAGDVGVVGDHVVVGGLGFAIGAEEGANDAIEHARVTARGRAVLGSEVDGKSSFGEYFVRDCRL